MIIHWHKSIIITLVGVLFLLEGCAVTLPAFYRASEFKPEFIGQITLMPAVDARIDKNVTVNLEDRLRGEAATILKEKGYPVVLTGASRETTELTNDDLRIANPALIKRLGPPGARWIMVLALIDLNVASSTGKVEVSGYLFDKETGASLWRDTSICLVEGGAIFGTRINGERSNIAIAYAVSELLASIPE